MNTSSIHSKLQEIERTHGVQIIFACESGSRAWGFASPDSDYDIRFLYLRKLEDYLGLSKQPDTLQFDLDADLHDIAGWDMSGPATFGAWGPFVANADIGKGAAHHYFVVTTAGTE